MSDLLNSLDPHMMDVGVAFLTVAFKYAGIYGIIYVLGRAIVRAFKGKEHFL